MMYMSHYKWECFPRQGSRDEKGGREDLYEHRVDRMAYMKEYGA